MKKRGSLKQAETRFNLLFLAPCLIIFIGTVIIPLIQAVPYSMWDWDGFSAEHTFIGLDNYISLLKDRSLYRPLVNTLQFTVVYVLASNILGFAIAVMLKRTTKYSSVLRSVFFIPFVLSTLLASFVFSYLYSDVFYSLLKLNNPLGNYKIVNYAIAVIAIWKDTGYCMILDLAALNMIPNDYYEAAALEGCTKWQSLTKITIPLMIPAFTTNIVLLMTWGLQAFDYAMGATGGGPGNYSETLAIFAYKNIFQYHKAGYGAAAGIILAVLLAAVTFVSTKLLRSREVEM